VASVQVSADAETSERDAHEVSGGVALAGTGVKGTFQTETGTTKSTGTVTVRTHSPVGAARKELVDERVPLVIDDFHYVDPAVQLQIIRNLKDPIFNGVPVIVVAVPHCAYDPVRIETEMTGRVEQLPIAFWSADELRLIPAEGFPALNVRRR
jgi:hypothetical protein